MKKSKIANIIGILFNLLLGIGIICLPFIPKLYNLLEVFGIKTFSTQTMFYKIMFYLCYLICLGVLFMLGYIFKNIYHDSPFSKRIERSLKVVALLFIALSIAVLIKTIFIPTIMSIVVIVVTFITSLCFYALSEIFKVAREYKNEVDYTI